jgi:hypothetical protein
MKKTITVIIELDDHSSSASDRDIKPYIERMVSFSVDSDSKHWEAEGDDHVLVVQDANLRKLHVRT